ncbi:hypothetical protein MESS2_960021 [Mesorhizobium metallidurans STM 2683]|uniref:Uncharacterized protein n=1 Tax=Mesorhizobium metallidurans STM 2683 TaxID=1297569 RepID=M5EZ97_9HYPH|nr:hypothetical protein MESS2_960021 [Mesorhizobium metallidurans STM 2683]
MREVSGIGKRNTHSRLTPRLSIALLPFAITCDAVTDFAEGAGVLDVSVIGAATRGYHAG